MEREVAKKSFSFIFAGESENHTSSNLTDEEKQKVNLWKQIVALSKMESTEFRVNRNAVGLFRFMDFCGIDKERFIRSYLFQLQPFMIHAETANLNKDRFSCIIDSSYRMPLWVEVIYKPLSGAVISFHEMNYYDQGLENVGNSSVGPLLCAPNGT